MLEHLSAGHHKENSRFARSSEGASWDGKKEEDSPLWRADWGIKQWVPYLLGMYHTYVYYFENNIYFLCVFKKCLLCPLLFSLQLKFFKNLLRLFYSN